MSVAEFVYTFVLRPKPLKAMVNAAIRRCIPASLRRHGAVIVLNQRDAVVSGAITFGVYEPAETVFFCAACQPGMTFLDIGANIGYYTALASKRIGEQGRIIALEPDPENFRYLQQNVAANGAHNAVCIQKAAAGESGVLRLYVNPENRGDNRLYANDLCDSSYEVEVSTVDTMLEECGVERVDLVKIDVQGFEGHVLRGMRQTIQRSEDLILLTEFWPFGLRSAGTSPEDLLVELEDAGLRLYELTPKGGLAHLTDKKAFIERHPGRKYANIVAVRGDRLPASLSKLTGNPK
jgi:FkbM family methyltransferase